MDGREAVDVLGPRGWVALPLMPLAGAGTARVVGVRRRAFAPAPGLHPTLPAQGPLTLRWRRPDGRAWRVVVHPWRPDGGAYDGLPADLDEAARRRAARFVATPLAGPGPGAGPDAAPDAVPDAAAPATAPPPGAATAWTLDLRRLWALAQSAPPAPGEAS